MGLKVRKVMYYNLDEERGNSQKNLTVKGTRRSRHLLKDFSLHTERDFSLDGIIHYSFIKYISQETACAVASSRCKTCSEVDFKSYEQVTACTVTSNGCKTGSVLILNHTNKKLL